MSMKQGLEWMMVQVYFLVRLTLSDRLVLSIMYYIKMHIQQP